MAVSFDNLFDKFLASKLRGAARLRSWKRGRWPSHLVRTMIEGGVVFDLDPDNYLENECIKTGFYEREVMDACSNACTRGGTFWDIGANIGIMSVLLKKQIPYLKVLSFECNPLTAYRLSSNIELNNLEIEIMNIALSSKTSIAQFFVQDTGNSGVSSLTPWADTAYQRVISVPTVSAEWLLDQVKLDIPNVLKIDVEGHELDVLRGFGTVLNNDDLHTIVFEADGPASLNKTRDLLECHGFQINTIYPKLTDNYTNFIATR